MGYWLIRQQLNPQCHSAGGPPLLTPAEDVFSSYIRVAVGWTEGRCLQQLLLIGKKKKRLDPLGDLSSELLTHRCRHRNRRNMSCGEGVVTLERVQVQVWAAEP